MASFVVGSDKMKEEMQSRIEEYQDAYRLVIKQILGDDFKLHNVTDDVIK